MMLRMTQRDSILASWLPMVCTLVLFALVLVGASQHAGLLSPRLNSFDSFSLARSASPTLESNSIIRPSFASVKVGIPVRPGHPQEFTVAFLNHFPHHTFIRYRLRRVVTALGSLSPLYVCGSSVEIIVLFVPFLRPSRFYASCFGRAPPTL